MSELVLFCCDALNMMSVNLRCTQRKNNGTEEEDEHAGNYVVTAVNGLMFQS